MIILLRESRKLAGLGDSLRLQEHLGVALDGDNREIIKVTKFQPELLIVSLRKLIE